MKNFITVCEAKMGQCWLCEYQEECGDYCGDNRPIPTLKCKVASMTLCEGRHAIHEAEDGAIFKNTVNPLDVDGLEDQAYSTLKGVEFLNLYVTGLTVALIAALNAARKLQIRVVLYHYDKNTGTYYPQLIK
jgi:hypothetical protein